MKHFEIKITTCSKRECIIANQLHLNSFTIPFSSKAPSARFRRLSTTALGMQAEFLRAFISGLALRISASVGEDPFPQAVGIFAFDDLRKLFDLDGLFEFISHQKKVRRAIQWRFGNLFRLLFLLFLSYK